MAINVTQSPASNVSANDPIVWKFQFTALGTGTQVKRMIYYLADASNNKIGDDYVWTPASTSEGTRRRARMPARPGAPT